MSISLLRRLLMKEAVKDTAGSSGIMSINKNITDKVEKQLQKYVSDAMQQGVDLDTLSPEQLKMIVQMNKPKPPRVIPADSPEGRGITQALFGKRGEVVDFPQKRSFKQEVDDMIKDGTITKGPRGMKKSKKVTDREMFKAANERLMSDVDSIIKNIKSMEPITAMKEANSVIGRKGKYKNLTPEQSKKILQDTEDHIFERDIPEEDFASGGRAGLRFGGDTMGGRNDRSRSSPGPDRSRVSNRQQANHDRAMSDRSNQGNRDYSPIKQIAKQTAISTAKTLARDKLMNTLGLAKFSNPIGIAMVLRNAYKQAKNPVLTEEDMTLGLMTDTQKDVIDKQGKMGKAIGSFDPDATFKAAKIFDDKGSEGVFGIGKREAEPMTREEYNEYISGKGFASGGVAGLLGERPRYQTGGDVSFDASDASVYGSSAITVTPDAVMDQFGNLVQSQTGNNFNPGRPIGGSNVTAPPGLPRPIVPPEQGGGGGRPPGGGGSGITTLPDGTVYNSGFPAPGSNVGLGYDKPRPMPPGGGLTLNPGAIIDPNLINDRPRPGIDPIMQGFQESEFRKNANMMQQDAVNFKYNGKDMMMNGSMAGAFQQYLDSIGKGDLMERNSSLLTSGGNSSLKQVESGIGTAEEEYAKIQEGKNRPSRDLRYGENMSFEEFKAEYDAGKTPMQQGSYKGPPLLAAQPLGGGMIQGFPGDPRLGAQQIEGNQLQMMMRGSGKARRMPTAPAIIDLPGMQATQPSLRQLEAQPMPFASPSPSSSPIGQAAEMANGGRAGFMAGGMGRRGFLKMLAGLGGGIAAAKTGLLKFAGKEPAKQVAKEIVQQSTTTPPPYFFKLADKIRTLGDDITDIAATTNREVVKKYKGFEMSEDVTTGDIVIKKRNEGVFYDQDGIISDEYIVYKPGQADEVTKMRTVDEYDEYTIRPDGDGKLTDAEDGLDSIDEILQEVDDQVAPIKNQTMNQTKSIKKASGGIARMLGE